MIGLHRVIGVPLDVVPRRRDQLVEHRRVDRCAVGDHLGRYDLQRRQRTLEEPPCRVAVAAGRDQHVDDLPVLVHRSVDVTPNAVDLDVGLIAEPPVTRRVPAEPAASASRGVNRRTQRKTMT
jgi:hypothetical protein